MGRLFEALRQAESPRLPRVLAEDQPPILCPVSEEAAQPEEEPAASEVPFIEVGPHRSVEGSAEVLASVPPLRVHAAPAAPSPGGPRVLFQPLPMRPARARFAAELVAYHAPDLPTGEQYRTLLGSLLEVQSRCSSGGGRCPVLLFTAARSGIGTTTILLNVAITAARQARGAVAVVDANLRHPAVAERLGLPAAPGLREVLGGSATLEEALQETDQDNLRALTAGLAVPGPGPRLVAQTMRSLLRQLRQRADLVLVDGPCWDGRADAVTLATAADVVYAVFPETEAETPPADAVVQAITEQGGRVGGCVLARR
jgi:Mrp family chromosome partitioning ATPase